VTIALDTEPRTVDSRKVGRATFTVPGNLPLGWHTLHAESGGQAAQETRAAAES
jgi:4-alpha-glucanotransferase